MMRLQDIFLAIFLVASVLAVSLVVWDRPHETVRGQVGGAVPPNQLPGCCITVGTQCTTFNGPDFHTIETCYASGGILFDEDLDICNLFCTIGGSNPVTPTNEPGLIPGFTPTNPPNTLPPTTPGTTPPPGVTAPPITAPPTTTEPPTTENPPPKPKPPTTPPPGTTPPGITPPGPNPPGVTPPVGNPPVNPPGQPVNEDPPTNPTGGGTTDPDRLIYCCAGDGWSLSTVDDCLTHPLGGVVFTGRSPPAILCGIPEQPRCQCSKCAIGAKSFCHARRCKALGGAPDACIYEGWLFGGTCTPNPDVCSR